MAIVKTLARALQPGDVVLDPIPSNSSADRAVVLAVAIAEPGPVGLQLGRLGPIPEHLARVATVAWSPDYVVDVERPEPSRVDRILEEHRIRAWHALAEERDALRDERDTLAAELLEERNRAP